MSKIICNAGTGQNAKSKFLYDNTIHRLTSIRHTCLDTSFPDSAKMQHCVMPPNRSDSSQALSFQLLSKTIQTVYGVDGELGTL